ncbi:hypothetical protein C8R45DRAFT_935539 [Mycena sanguinolenta]|nr:hypothetical protein C8R45DRAFT_935539 [Mycena sanguinolenta]
MVRHNIKRNVVVVIHLAGGVCLFIGIDRGKICHWRLHQSFVERGISRPKVTKTGKSFGRVHALHSVAPCPCSVLNRSKESEDDKTQLFCSMCVCFELIPILLGPEPNSNTGSASVIGGMNNCQASDGDGQLGITKPIGGNDTVSGGKRCAADKSVKSTSFRPQARSPVRPVLGFDTHPANFHCPTQQPA